MFDDVDVGGVRDFVFEFTDAFDGLFYSCLGMDVKERGVHDAAGGVWGVF